MKLKIIAAALLIAAFANKASATEGFVSRDVYLRAGPGTEYPVISTVFAGQEMEIEGCLENWYWCDVQSGPLRGWVSGRYLETVFNEREVYIYQARPVHTIPIITFEIGNYWHSHYRDRPFYIHRDRWIAPRPTRTVVIHDRAPRPPHYDRDKWHDRPGNAPRPGHGPGRGDDHHGRGHDRR